MTINCIVSIITVYVTVWVSCHVMQMLLNTTKHHKKPRPQQEKKTQKMTWFLFFVTLSLHFYFLFFFFRETRIRIFLIKEIHFGKLCHKWQFGTFKSSNAKERRRLIDSPVSTQYPKRLTTFACEDRPVANPVVDEEEEEGTEKSRIIMSISFKSSCWSWGLELILVILTATREDVWAGQRLLRSLDSVVFLPFQTWPKFPSPKILISSRFCLHTCNLGWEWPSLRSLW